MLFSPLPSPFWSLTAPLRRHQTGGRAVLGGPGDRLVTWPSGSMGGLPRSQPAPREQRRGGDNARRPGTWRSPWHTPRSTGLTARWPAEAPYCSHFTISWWNAVQKGTNWELYNLPLLQHWETRVFFRLLCSPVGESNQLPSPLEFPWGKPKLEAHFSLTSPGSCYVACLMWLPKRVSGVSAQLDTQETDAGQESVTQSHAWRSHTRSVRFQSSYIIPPSTIKLDWQPRGQGGEEPFIHSFIHSTYFQSCIALAYFINLLILLLVYITWL